MSRVAEEGYSSLERPLDGPADPPFRRFVIEPTSPFLIDGSLRIDPADTGREGDLAKRFSLRAVSKDRQ